MSKWEKWWMGVASLITLIVLAFLVLWFIDLTQPRVFQGYYLRHGSTWSGSKQYTIKIAFDNRIDPVAFRTYNPNEALEVLEQLQAAGMPTN